MDQELKNKLLELVNQLDQEDFLVVDLKKFVETYDGSNTNELKRFVTDIVVLLQRVEDLKIKAEGYDALVMENADFNNRIKDIEKDFKVIKDGKPPFEAPVFKKN